MCELQVEQPVFITCQGHETQCVFRLSSHVLQSDFFYTGVNIYGPCLHEDEQQMEGTVVSCAEKLTLTRSLDIC